MIKKVRLQADSVFYFTAYCLLFALFFWGIAASAEVSSDLSHPNLTYKEQLKHLVKRELIRNFPNTDVLVKDDFNFGRTDRPDEVEKVVFVGLKKDSRAAFKVGRSEFTVSFQAMKEVLVANRRLHPKTVLSEEHFQATKIDLADRRYSTFKGMFVDSEEDISLFETKQTILQGQFALITAIRKTPLIKKGQVVRLHLKSDGLVLSTTATALESGYSGSQVRVITQSTKKKMVGSIRSGDTVEVRL